MKKRILVAAVLLLILGLGFFFVTMEHKSAQRQYSSDGQYSVYTRLNVFSDLFCAFTIMDCSHSGRIYLYDEKEEKVLASAYHKIISDDLFRLCTWKNDDVLILRTLSIFGKPKEHNWNLPRAINSEEGLN